VITSKQRSALEALLGCPTVKGAARAANIDPKTMRGYLKDPEFCAEYKARTREMVDDAARQAKQALNPALSTLTEICADAEAGSASRVAAARALLDYSLRLAEINDIIGELGDDVL